MSAKIKKSELAKMLHVSERSIDSYVEQGIIPVPTYPIYPETEMLFDRTTILKILGIKEITDEPFIELEDAAKIMDVELPTALHYVKTGKIPSYRLKNVKGHKFLFLKSELKALMKYSFEWNVDFVNLFFSQLFLKATVEEILSPVITKDLKPNELQIIKDFLINRKSHDVISKEIGLTRERVRQLFQRACKRIYYRMKEIPVQLTAMDGLMKENSELRTENKILKSLVDRHKLLQEGQIDVLKIKIEDVDFSNRLLRIFKDAEIITIGDMMKWSKHDMLKFRNFGATCLSEVEKVLARYKLKLPSDKVFVTH